MIPKIFKGWGSTPPKVKNPITVCTTDFPTKTREAVRAEQTDAHRNCENVRIHPDITKVMNVGKNPSSGKENIAKKDENTQKNNNHRIGT